MDDLMQGIHSVFFVWKGIDSNWPRKITRFKYALRICLRLSHNHGSLPAFFESF